MFGSGGGPMRPGIDAYFERMAACGDDLNAKWQESARWMDICREQDAEARKQRYPAPLNEDK